MTPNAESSFGSGALFPPCNPFPVCGGNIPQSFPTMGGWNPPSSGPNPSYNSQGWNAHMGSVYTSYISSIYMSSTMPFPVNASFMENPPPTFDITSGWNPFSNMGNPRMEFLH
jgi:hypothetical protein